MIDEWPSRARRPSARIREGAKDLVCECIRNGRDPTNDAVLIVDKAGHLVETIRLLDALRSVLRDRLDEQAVQQPPRDQG